MRLIATCLIAFMVSSCGTVSKQTPYSFDSVRLELGMNDLQFLGETEISVEYTTYLGFINTVEKVNGQKYDPTHKKLLKVKGDEFSTSDKLKLAAYKLTELYPDGVYFQIVRQTKEVDKLFLGSLKKETARVRVYKFKQKHN